MNTIYGHEKVYESVLNNMFGYQINYLNMIHLTFCT